MKTSTNEPKSQAQEAGIAPRLFCACDLGVTFEALFRGQLVQLRFGPTDHCRPSHCQERLWDWSAYMRVLLLAVEKG